MAVCSEIRSTNINAHVERLSAKPAGARNKRCGCQSVSPDHPLMQLHDKCSGPVQKIEMQFLLSKSILFKYQLLDHTAYIFRRSTAIIRQLRPKGMCVFVCVCVCVCVYIYIYS